MTQAQTIAETKLAERLMYARQLVDWCEKEVDEDGEPKSLDVQSALVLTDLVQKFIFASMVDDVADAMLSTVPFDYHHLRRDDKACCKVDAVRGLTSALWTMADSIKDLLKSSL
jgi:hypothetical protein